jgi:AraC-like DNA-binding protein
MTGMTPARTGQASGGRAPGIAARGTTTRRATACTAAGKGQTTGRAAATATIPCIAVYAPREWMRALARAAFPRRRARLVIVRTAADLAHAFHAGLVDAALIDLGTGSDDAWAAAAYAREFPSAPFFAVTPLRSADGPTLARCAALDFADVLVESVDDRAIRDLVLPLTFRARFVVAMREPPPGLLLTTDLQRKTWSCVISHGGLPVRTTAVATVVGVTREHLSRAFSTARAPNLKRVIDLVRLVAAAELAKNPGYDMRDVASVLGFASPSHLSSTTQRVLGLRPASLARLRAIDLIDRFAGSRGRSRTPGRSVSRAGRGGSP